MSFLSIVIALLPIVLIGLFIYHRDKKREPSKLLFKLFVCGVSSCYPAVLLELIISSFFPDIEYMNFLQIFLYAFFGIALIEELCKWFFVYKISYNHDDFDSLYDMVVYSSFVSLGFACFENILYVSSSGISTGLLRAITAVPGHVCDGILMGSYLSLAKVNELNGNHDNSKKFKILSLLIPMITHGIYDFCIFIENNIFILIFVIFVRCIFVICFKKVKDISTNNYKFRYKNKYCISCGLTVNSRFCPRCGKENK